MIRCYAPLKNYGRIIEAVMTSELYVTAEYVILYT